MPANAPEFADLRGPLKALVRKIGNTEDHRIEVEEGQPGKGWLSLDDLGWVRIFETIMGYRVQFTLSGWEWWCRQCDAEDGQPLTPVMFD